MKFKQTFLYRNSLTIVLLALMLIFWAGQLIAGIKTKDKERIENGLPLLSVVEYAKSGHFIQATFENWESEFLQMGCFVLFTIFLRQKGSSISKSLNKKEEVDRELRVNRKTPWPVKRGGVWLTLYSNSLTIALFMLFIFSFCMHFYGSLKSFNEQQSGKHMPLVSASDYIGNSEFWFESFQNWQSEFLAVASLIILSIFLRQKGSPESKPVDAANGEDK